MPNETTMLEVTTRRYIDNEPKLRDFVYNNDPVTSMAEDKCLKSVGAGTTINFNMVYGVNDGGSYLSGADMPATIKQTEQQLRFDWKYQAAMIAFQLEQIRVINYGNNPEVIVDLVETKTNEAYMQLGAELCLQMYLQGQTGQFVPQINGLMEALSDGSAPSMDGTVYSNYGQLTRATYGGRMKSPAPVDFAGTNITLPRLEQMYQSINFGGDYECNVINTTPKVQGSLRSQYQTQQQFIDVKIGRAGFSGLAYNNAAIMASRYVPGSHLTSNSGTNDNVAVAYFGWTTGGASPRYPSLSGLSTGESIWMLNMRPINFKYYRSANEPYNGSMQEGGFIPSATSTKVVAKLLLAHNIGVSPGYSCTGFNIAA